MTSGMIAFVCTGLWCYAASCLTWGMEISDEGDGVLKIMGRTALVGCIPLLGQMGLIVGGLFPFVALMIYAAQRR